MKNHNSKFKITVDQLKVRLDKYLAEHIKDISRSQIQRDIEAGMVFVNGQKILESKYVVRLNDEVSYLKSNTLNLKSDIKPTNTPLKVLYNNHGLLIIDKPAGMVVHPGAGFKGETLASALLYQFKDIKLVGEEGRPGIVHRLDKDTSGVILVAKTQEMYEYLKNAFAERKVKKEYIALVLGKVEKPHGFIETPIGKSKIDFRKYEPLYEIRKGRNTKNTNAVIEPKEALTEYRVLEYLQQADQLVSGSAGQRGKGGVDTYTLVMVKLHTGRTHQIRVHFKSLGHPLIGDSLYGSKFTKLDGLHRQFLHAKKIEVQLPDKTWIEAESELAGDLKEVLLNLNSKIVKQL